jgi:hypothetical protein
MCVFDAHRGRTQADGMLPLWVKVQFIESEEIEASRVVSHTRLHVQPVDGYNGFVDGLPCEITWVSANRTKVRVRAANSGGPGGPLGTLWRTP